CGIAQHSKFSVADRAHGYCIDDNARALMFVLRARAMGLQTPAIETLALRYAAFVTHGWNPDVGRFRNFMGYDRRWLEDIGCEDSCGRALWSIGEAARLAFDDDFRGWALNLAGKVLPHTLELTSLRSRAFAALGLASLLHVLPNFMNARTLLRHCATTLME